jgi:NitT/TauT family transport system substrate-binding protein
MLEDGVFTTQKWVKSRAHRAIAKKFLAASFRGWIYCRTHLAACIDMVLSRDSALPRGHQLWMLNEINALIWPTRLGIGVMDPVAFARTARIAKTFARLGHLPGHEAYRTDFARAADAILRHEKLEITGRRYEKARVTVTAGGK